MPDTLFDNPNREAATEERAFDFETAEIIEYVFYRNLWEKWAEERKKKGVENQIIRLLSENNKLNQKQLAAKTGKSIASVQRSMKKLSEQGKIVREVGKCFGHWKVK